MATTHILNKPYLNLNMEIYVPLMDDIEYLVNETGETHEILYKLILDLSFYGHYFEYPNEYLYQLVLKLSELQTISKAIDRDVQTLIRYYSLMAKDSLISTEFVVISTL